MGPGTGASVHQRTSHLEAVVPCCCWTHPVCASQACGTASPEPEPLCWFPPSGLVYFLWELISYLTHCSFFPPVFTLSICCLCKEWIESLLVTRQFSACLHNLWGCFIRILLLSFCLGLPSPLSDNDHQHTHGKKTVGLSFMFWSALKIKYFSKYFHL